MTVGEFIKSAQAVWGAFDGDPDEVFGIWRGALADVKPHNLKAAFDWLVKNSKYKPKPADVFSALDKIGISSEKPKAGELKYGAMVDYANARRWEMMDDWRRRNFALWKEAQQGRWDGCWDVEARKRAHELAQVEYVSQHHGWPQKTADLFAIIPEEIVSPKELCLHFTAEQIDGFRRMGAMVSQKPERVWGWKSVGEAAA